MLLILIPIAIFLITSFLDLTGGATEPPRNPTEPAGQTSEYQNEDYQVPGVNPAPPDVPMPETYGEARTWMEDNPIYRQDIAVPVRCDISAVNLMNSSVGQLQDHMNELMGCLMRVFGPPMEQAGYTPVRPSVTVYTTQIQTPCGAMPMQNAAYCMADQQVYYAANLPNIVPPQLQSADFVVESVMAHEFAHAMQARTGILISEMAWQQQVDKATALELSRRTEVQADCWTGQFMQSVAQSVGLSEPDEAAIGQLFYAIGDDSLTSNPDVVGNHGRGATRQAWYQQGLRNTSMGACNSFTPASNQVR